MAQKSAQSMDGLSVRRDGEKTPIARTLPQEVPVALVYDGTTQAVMMASPGDIQDFAYGFSLTEGIITDLDQIESFEIVTHDLGLEARFWLHSERTEAMALRRRQMIGPVGCGLCGIDSLEQALRDIPKVTAPPPDFTTAQIAQAPDALRAHQPLHDQTHAVHAAGFCRPDQGIIAAREDVGRHNALDKLIGAMIRQGVNASKGAIILTSRISVDMVQKCAMAGAPMIIAVSAPTAQALRVAQESGITLAAFARGGRFDLYSHSTDFQQGASDVA